MAGGGTSRTTARVLPEAAACGADPEPRKCRLRTSKRNFAGREALAYPQTVSVTEGEHPPGGRPGHSVHIADLARCPGRLNGVTGGMQIILSAQPREACGCGSEPAPFGRRG